MSGFLRVLLQASQVASQVAPHVCVTLPPLQEPWTGPSFGSEEVILDGLVSGVGCGERHLGHRSDLLPSLFGAKLLDVAWREEIAKLPKGGTVLRGGHRADLLSELRSLVCEQHIAVFLSYGLARHLVEHSGILALYELCAKLEGGAAQVHVRRNRRSSRDGFVLPVPAMQDATIGRRRVQAFCL